MNNSNRSQNLIAAGTLTALGIVIMLTFGSFSGLTSKLSNVLSMASDSLEDVTTIDTVAAASIGTQGDNVTTTLMDTSLETVSNEVIPEPLSNQVMVDAAQLEALQAQNEELRKAIAASQLPPNSVVVDATELDTLQAQNEELRQHALMLQSQTENLETALQGAQLPDNTVVVEKVQLDSLQANNQTLKTEYDQLVAQYQELNTTFESAQQTVLQYQQQDQLLRQAVDTLKGREWQYQQELQKANATINQLQNQLVDISNQGQTAYAQGYSDEGGEHYEDDDEYEEEYEEEYEDEEYEDEEYEDDDDDDDEDDDDD